MREVRHGRDERGKRPWLRVRIEVVLKHRVYIVHKFKRSTRAPWKFQRSIERVSKKNVIRRVIFQEPALNLNTPGNILPVWPLKILTVEHSSLWICETFDVDDHLPLKLVGRDRVRRICVDKIRYGHQRGRGRPCEYTKAGHDSAERGGEDEILR